MESVSPALPLELEREIFEICALLRPKGIPKLLLVAQRVKEWVEPLLYRTIVVEVEHSSRTPIFPHFTTTSLSSALESKNFHPDAARHLLLYANARTYKDVLARCTGVENLWINDLTDMAPLIAPLPLKHLYTNLLSLLRTLSPTYACFSRITHLEVMDDWEEADSEIWSGLSLLPQLTHFSFNSSYFVPSARELLEISKSLAVLVFLESGQDPSPAAELSHDLRFVQMGFMDWFEDWKMGVHSGEDYWSRAENFIAKRRSGEINALQYQIPDDPRD
ncbi:hypothetical protein C8R44DRAFT_875677 [Mycena epipterygia]|nr:hypothetical protein C8R44DRAFT_875677 [Mycena epipterygia]